MCTQMPTPYIRKCSRRPIQHALSWLSLYIAFGLLSSQSYADAFPAVIELSSLDGSNGFTLVGIDPFDNSGRTVNGIGDVNGDGIDDLVVSAGYADPNGIENAGESYVVFGQQDEFSAVFELSGLDGKNGFVVRGINEGDRTLSGTGHGDINGDGVADMIFGSFLADPNGIDSGEVYVVFGRIGHHLPVFELASLDGSNGFLLTGITKEDYAGSGRSVAGDINGDGYDDLLIGAYGADPNGDQSGQGYVVFGHGGKFPSEMSLSALDSSNGFVLNGINPGDLAGAAIRAAGDVNDDGVGDFILSASQADPNGDKTGESYVVFGSVSGFPPVLELSSLNGMTGFVLNGIEEGDRAGFIVSSAGDFNSDGYDDILIGSYQADTNGLSSGECYLVFGTSDGFEPEINLSSLNGTSGFTIFGIDVGDRTCRSASGAGDVNGDGFDDIIIGAPGAGPGFDDAGGAGYIVFGHDETLSPSFNLSSLDGSNGFVLQGIDFEDQAGTYVSRAGDVNGDGLADIAIGAHTADPGGRVNAGETYILFGRSTEVDTDNDGVVDTEDNCTMAKNIQQVDTDRDGYGNACDSDFNNDCVVNFVDVSFFTAGFSGNDPLFDLNNDGAINFIDFGVVVQSYLNTPGPGLGVCNQRLREKKQRPDSM